MSRPLFVGLVCVLSLSACVIDNGGNSDDPGAGSTSVVPRTGEWYYADVTQVSSTCSAGNDGVAGNFLIDTASAGGFHVVPGDGTDPFSCSLSGSSFDCPDRGYVVEDLRPSIDAVLTAHATATGSFSATTHGTGSQEATITCSGAACSAAGSWPCHVEVSFEIAAR